MNNILTPEKNLFLLKKYHTSGKMLIPLIGLSFLSNKYNNKNVDYLLSNLNILNIGFHSYVSMSCVITDYIKPKNISKGIRYGNLFSHSIAISGYMIYILKKNIQ